MGRGVPHSCHSPRPRSAPPRGAGGHLPSTPPPPLPSPPPSPGPPEADSPGGGPLGRRRPRRSCLQTPPAPGVANHARAEGIFSARDPTVSFDPRAYSQLANASNGRRTRK
eukprot:366400-Pyramimonas_sp.AAC.1